MVVLAKTFLLFDEKNAFKLMKCLNLPIDNNSFQISVDYIATPHYLTSTKHISFKAIKTISTHTKLKMVKKDTKYS